MSHKQHAISLNHDTRWPVVAAVTLLIFGLLFAAAGFGAGTTLLYRTIMYYQVDGSWSSAGVRLIVAMNLFGTAGVVMLLAAFAAWKQGWRRSFAATLIAGLLVLLATMLHPGAVGI